MRCRTEFDNYVPSGGSVEDSHLVWGHSSREQINSLASQLGDRV